MRKVIVIGVGGPGIIDSVMEERLIAEHGTDAELITIDEAKQRGINIIEIERHTHMTIEIKAPPMIEYPQVIETTLAYERKKEREQWKYGQKHYRK